MNVNYYSNSLSPAELQQQLVAQRREQSIQRRKAGLRNVANQRNQSRGPVLAMPDMVMSNPDSLDDIIRQNINELHRRRSVPQQFSESTVHSEADRRLSMLELSANDFREFDFASMGAPDNTVAGGFVGLGEDMSLPGQSDAFPQTSMMNPHSTTGFSLSHDGISNIMAFSDLNVNQLATPNSMDVFPSAMGNQFTPSAMDSVDNDFSIDLNMESGPLVGIVADASGDIDASPDDLMTVDQAFGSGASTPPRPQGPQVMNVDPALASFRPNLPPSLSRNLSSSTGYQSPLSATIPQGSGGPPGTTAPSPTSSLAPATRVRPTLSREKTLYSKSGFDMLRALWYVATRPQPQVQLGAVDMSCAFVVCDVDLNDCPIIYVSDNFQNLTGYSKHEIMGQNCRFLQAPNGKVEAGSRREFVENNAVYNLKKKIEDGREVQQSLINYRKGGKPFLNMLTMIPIPWDNTNRVKYFIGFQIDLVECPDAISGYDQGAMQIDYKHSHIDQYIWTPPSASQLDLENGHTLGIDDVSTLLQQFNPRGVPSDWHKQSWDKMLLENADDVVHVLSLKGLFLYLSPSCKKVLEYDSTDLVGSSLSSICHPSDIVPVTRELKETSLGSPVNIVFRIRRKQSGYTWFESHGSLFVEQGKGRKCIILVGRKRPVFALQRRDLDSFGGIGDSEFWTKVSTSGMFLFVSSNVRSLLDLLPESLEGTSIQELMRKESRPEFGRAIEKARRGKTVTCKHEVQNKRGQVLQAQTILYPGDAVEGQKPSFLIAQTKLLKASSRAIAPTSLAGKSGGPPSTASVVSEDASSPGNGSTLGRSGNDGTGMLSQSAGGGLGYGSQESGPAANDNVFVELKTTRATSWQYELRQMEKQNRTLAEELAQLLSNKKKRKRRKGGNLVRDCANCHTRNTPEWRRGPSGNRDLCNSCGLRWAKQVGRVSPRNSSRGGNGDSQSKKSNSPSCSSPLHREASTPQDGMVSATVPSRSSSATSNNTGTTAGRVDTNTSSSATPVAPSGKGSGNGSGNGSGSDSVANKAHAHLVSPPQSQPLLAGGSGLGGGGMEMTAIREEREYGA